MTRGVSRATVRRLLRQAVGTLAALALVATVGVRAHRAAAPAMQAATPASSLAQPTPPSMPPAATQTIDFAEDVAPIFLKSCVRCHARGAAKGRFSLETREGLLEGGRDGAAVELGNSAESLLVKLVAGLDPEMVMPEKGSRLTAAEVGILRAWIDQGAPWDTRVSFARQPPRNLDPRVPVLPPARAGLQHPVDRLLAAHDSSAAASAPRADDRTLARRLSLDLVGLLPEPDAVDAFVSDTRPDKVARLADRLLGDTHRYATHWLTFWNDLLRNDYRGPGYIDGGRRQISGWLFTALAENMPFDTFVATLVNPTPRSEGFTRGIIWRGVVNASQTPPMQAAQNISQVFMGVNLKCASCHDSFINEWQLADAYGLAGVYADEPLEMVECDRPTGKTAALKFLYPSLGEVDPAATRDERLRQLAAVMVDQKNGRLSRTIVNRLWARLFGRGLVEPLDDMDKAAWQPDLLDWLAQDLVTHGYDLKHTLAQMVSSDAYQRVAIDAGDDIQVPFRGPVLRRLSAEQFADALGSVTGVWPGEPAGEFEASIARAGDAPPLSAVWIWRDRAASRPDPDVLYVRGDVELRNVPVQAPLLIAHPRQFVLYVNGVRAAEGGGPTRPRVVDIAPHLQRGRNVLALKITGPPQPAPSVSPAPATSAAASAPATPAPAPAPAPKALLLQLHARPSPDAPLDVVMTSSDTWRWSSEEHPGWQQPLYPDRTWAHVQVIASGAAAPAAFRPALDAALASASLIGRTRAALRTATPLTTALGRPGREQVVTVRADGPTTLQALELANGETFASLLRAGATRLLDDSGRPAIATATAGATPDALAARIYRRALGRLPTPDERAVALDLLGPAPHVEQVEDLLWGVTMLPEFRLIH